MTIILSLINEDQAILVSDRKLSGDGSLKDWTKSALVTTKDGRFGLGISGLAKADNFDTGKWILEAIIACGPPDYTSHGIITRLATAATKLFAEHGLIRRVRPEQRRLTIMLSGYLDIHSPPLAANALVTNFQDWRTGIDSDVAWPVFDTRFENERRPSGGQPLICVQRIGRMARRN